MKRILTTLTVLLVAGTASAIWSDEFPDRNHAMTCGELEVVTENYTTSLHHLHNKGQITGSTDLGRTFVVTPKGEWIELYKTKEADKEWFGLGDPKGYGLYEGSGYELDLTNTKDNYQIDLLVPGSSEPVECDVLGDCC